MFDINQFLERLVELIDRGPTSRAKIADKAGITDGTIYCWKQKMHVPLISTVMLVLQEIKPTPEELLWLFGYEGGGNE